MRISAFVLGALFAVGCSSADNKKLDEFADRACACKDAECGQGVMKDFLAWVQENKNPKGDEAKAEKSLNRMQDCIKKLGAAKMMNPGGDKPAADKPAEPAADKPADKPAEESK